MDFHPWTWETNALFGWRMKSGRQKTKKPSHVFGWCEKVERGKILLFDLEENEMIENTIYLNLLLCSCYNFFIKIFYKDKKKVLLGQEKIPSVWFKRGKTCS